MTSTYLAQMSHYLNEVRQKQHFQQFQLLKIIDFKKMKKTQTKIQYNNMYSLKIDYARFSSHQVSTKMVGYLIAMLYFVSDCLFRKLMLWHFVLEIWAISQEPHDHFWFCSLVIIKGQWLVKLYVHLLCLKVDVLE